jgi:putative hydrolase
MRLTSDFHTHTNYTHGISSIEENVIQADLIGLQAIAITEHSYNSVYSIKNGDLDRMREDIDRIKDKYKTRILLGIEANLISKHGDIDISDEELEKLDLVVLGFHKMSRTSLKEKLTFVLPNLLRKKATQKQIERNTKAYINAMDKHRVSILAHLNYGGCRVDCLAIAKKCAEKGIYIELNGKRIDFTKKDIDDMLSTDVKFIIDSDAHDAYDVGRNSRAFNVIEKYNIPLDRIVNIDGRLPELK